MLQPNPKHPMVSRLDGGGEFAGPHWSGVTRISDGETTGSGVLMGSGLHVLTAAHVVDGYRISDTRIFFPTETNPRDIQAITTYPGFRIGEHGFWHDLAIVTLEQSAPPDAQRYGLYTGNDEVGQAGIITGYGQGYDPNNGSTDDSGPTLRQGLNTIDTTGKPFDTRGWEGSLEDQLLFDYDDGTYPNDSLGERLGDRHLGLGELEAMISPGDSGGGLFLTDNEDGWLLAGVHGYTVSTGEDPETPIGNIGGSARVSSYTDWIFEQTARQQHIRARDSEPPSTEEVPMQVDEGQGVYFLVEIPGGAAQQSAVEFFTRDGTARAGLDYIPTSGEIEFEPGDHFARVWVQTLTDAATEGEEDFELVLTNPEGADFPESQTELTASRVISEDDVHLAGVTDLAAELFGELG